MTSNSLSKEDRERIATAVSAEREAKETVKDIGAEMASKYGAIDAKAMLKVARRQYETAKAKEKREAMEEKIHQYELSWT